MTSLVEWFRSTKELPRKELWPEFSSHYGGTEDSCADAYLDGLMTGPDKADYEERFFVANRILRRLIPRIQSCIQPR